MKEDMNRPDNFYGGNPKSDATGFVDDEVQEAMDDWERSEDADALRAISEINSEPVDIEDLTHELGEDN